MKALTLKEARKQLEFLMALEKLERESRKVKKQPRRAQAKAIAP